MVPYFEQPALSLGPITIQSFGLLVALALVVGYRLALWRAGRQGLDTGVTESMGMYALVFGFAGAHLYSVLAYFPQRLVQDPWLLLRFWENISSFGGIIGGLIGIWVFFRFKRPDLGADRGWRHFDAAAFAFPFAWVLGRLGCTFAHDHPGTVTAFPLGRSLESAGAQHYITRVYEAAGRAAELPPPAELAGLAFHDLGWYEFLYTLLVIVPVFLLLDRKERRPGFFVAGFLLLYAPVRFALDFLRVGDARYLGLTPAQYAAVAALAAGILLAVKWLRSGAPSRLEAEGPAATAPEPGAGVISHGGL